MNQNDKGLARWLKRAVLGRAQLLRGGRIANGRRALVALRASRQIEMDV